jgi:hypothetical protein
MLWRRSLASVSRQFSRRSIATTPRLAAQQQSQANYGPEFEEDPDLSRPPPIPRGGSKAASTIHTVEDMQALARDQLYKEGGSREDRKLRHFTGEFWSFAISKPHNILLTIFASQLWVCS